MPTRFSFGRFVEIIRFYQAAAVNTLFGFGIYAIFIHGGMNVYLAQFIATVLGVAFNYLTYSRHVFRESAAEKWRFLAAYGCNYLIGLGLLALLSQFIASNYLIGLLALLLTSVINYLALKHLVFIRRIVR